MGSISTSMRQHIAQQANFQCGYCLTREIVSGIPLTLEHLIPKSKGGRDIENNLWLSCRLCNETKGVLVEAHDVETGELVPLFHPRVQKWTDHFTWSENGTRIIGKTRIGRATVNALSLNSEFRILARELWVEAGLHPPEASKGIKSSI